MQMVKIWVDGLCGEVIIDDNGDGMDNKKLSNHFHPYIYIGKILNSNSLKPLSVQSSVWEAIFT